MSICYTSSMVLTGMGYACCDWKTTTKCVTSVQRVCKRQYQVGTRVLPVSHVSPRTCSGHSQPTMTLISLMVWAPLRFMIWLCSRITHVPLFSHLSVFRQWSTVAEWEGESGERSFFMRDDFKCQSNIFLPCTLFLFQSNARNVCNLQCLKFLSTVSPLICLSSLELPHQEFRHRALTCAAVLVTPHFRTFTVIVMLSYNTGSSHETRVGITRFNYKRQKHTQMGLPEHNTKSLVEMCEWLWILFGPV